jgi:integrase/recombinase XerD
VNFQSWKDKFVTEMELRRSAKGTIENYTTYVEKFLLHFNGYVDPQHVPTDEIKKFLVAIGKESSVGQKQATAALKKFYLLAVKFPRKMDSIPYPRIISALPTIIGKNELLDRISKVKDARYRAMFVLLYGTGLRVGELVKLKVTDFNKERKEITVRNGKGGKDRIVPYTDSIRDELKAYFYQRKESEWFFHGENPNNYVSKSTVEKNCRDLIDAHPHQLRHCFAVNFIESGGSIYVLKDILGHKDIRTTERYLRVTRAMYSVPNAIDELRNAA